MEERGVTEPCLALTLNEPSSPDCIVQTDLVPPQQTQTLERLPLGRDDFTTARKKIVTPKKTLQLIHGKCEMVGAIYFVFSWDKCNR